MLTQIYIENLAVIEKASVSFGKNFTVFTGETGAGKSILISGINAILGGRASREIVRTGAQKAVISAVFTELPERAAEKLCKNDIDFSDEIIIRREITADGRSTAKINGQPVTTAVLRDVAQDLIDIHGQHDSRILLSPETHIDIIDNFGELSADLEKYRATFKELQAVSRRIKTLAVSESESRARVEKLKGIIAELEAAELMEGEEEALEAELKMFRNSAESYELLNAVRELLYEENGAAQSVRLAGEKAYELSDYMPESEETAKRLEGAAIELEDLEGDINSLLSALNADPARQNEVEERLSFLKRLQKRYSMTISDLQKLHEDSVKELAGLSLGSEEIERLSKERSRLLTEATHLAKELSKKRAEAGERLSKSVCEELSALDMPGVKMAASIEQGKLTVNGMDKAELLISANPGEPPKPISKIASGGELSRIMLALKSVLADRDDIPTLIFDEIDTGISGIAAGKVAKKLSEISRHRQVICITHLSQLAAEADDHILISKKTENGRTYTSVTELDFDGRASEIARILAGEDTTELVMKNAEEMLINKQKRRESEKK